jgi:hypothetical protein
MPFCRKDTLADELDRAALILEDIEELEVDSFEAGKRGEGEDFDERTVKTYAFILPAERAQAEYLALKSMCPT